VLPGAAPRPLPGAEKLALEVDTPVCAGFACAARCRTRTAAGEVEGVAFVEVEPSSKRVAGLRLFWEG
jgi:hypothetical protein